MSAILSGPQCVNSFLDCYTVLTWWLLHSRWSIRHKNSHMPDKIYTRFLYLVNCYYISSSLYILWTIYPFPSGLLHWPYSNHKISLYLYTSLHLKEGKFELTGPSASIHYADGRLTARSREVSKPRDSGFDFSNRPDISAAEMHVKC